MVLRSRTSARSRAARIESESIVHSGAYPRELFELLGAGVVFQITADGASQAIIGSRLHIAPDGTVTLLTGKMELGQGCRTLLSE